MTVLRWAIALAVLPASAQPQPVIRVPVRVVMVPTLVLSQQGRFLPALELRDFRVFDNERPQKAALDPEILPVSVAVAVQVNRSVRSYVPFIAKVGSAIDLLLAGETGESAVVTYGDEVKVAKPFDGRDVQPAFRKLAPAGKRARMVDAGMRAIELLKGQRRDRSRVLLLIGQAIDDGSENKLSALRREVEQENVAVYTFVLPQFGQAFVSDTFSLQGLSSTTDRGGFKAGVELGNLIPVLTRSAQASEKADPFSLLTAASGGTQLHFRSQAQLEEAIAILGVELRSIYMLSYTPDSAEAGYHAIRVEVSVPGAHVHTRPGYWMTGN